MCFSSSQGPDNEDTKEKIEKDSYQGDPNIITSDLVEGNWYFFPAMHSVMEAIKATSPDGGAKSRRSPEYTCECLSFLFYHLYFSISISTIVIYLESFHDM